MALTLMIWGSTALLQSYAHGRLATAFNPMWHVRLVRSNWARTVVWLLRGVLVAVAGPGVSTGHLVSQDLMTLMEGRPRPG